MAKSHDVKVIKKALELASIKIHGTCPHPVPSQCCDVGYISESFIRQAEEAIRLEHALQAARLKPDEVDPKSDTYIGHNELIRLGLAKCTCPDTMHPDFWCPLHGR